MHDTSTDEEPLRWRVIGTDSESNSGVAPICSFGHHDDLDVYVACCPHPHLECWSESQAREVRDMLNAFGVEVCS